MIDTQETRIVKDPSGKKLIVTRFFAAPLTKVWRAWTESRYLDEWWAPRPWKTQTKTMNFAPGGSWLYAMVGPANETHWCRTDYQAVEPEKRFTGVGAFCDENGRVTNEIPSMQWDIRFTSTGDGTTVNVHLSFDNEASLEKIVQMGFKEGFTAAHGNLDELLAKN